MTHGDEQTRQRPGEAPGPAAAATGSTSARKEGKAAREARLAAALRDNLRRRKAAVAGSSEAAGDGRAGDGDDRAAGGD